MEDEIRAEFTKNGFSFDEEEEILEKCEFSSFQSFSPFAKLKMGLKFVPSFYLSFELFEIFRPYILYTVQSQCFRSRIQLGCLLSQQVRI